MNTEILIVTFARDAEYLQMCLQSIARYASGFYGVTCVFPERDSSVITPILETASAKGITFNEKPGCGHLHHMVQKCRADQHCSNADLIAHVDSDCIFIEPVTPDDYISNGKPILLVQKYESLRGAVPWKPIVDRTMKMNAVYETMRLHPAVHWKGIYDDLRKYIERVHNRLFDEYVLSLKNDFPPGFTEFNALGQIVMTTNWRTQYTIHDLDALPFPHSKLVQFWSHSPPDKEQQIWNEGKQITVIPQRFAYEHC